MKERVKMRQMPGDVPKQEKIAMLEGTHPEKARSKSYRKQIRSRERAAAHERAKKETKDT